MDFTQSIPLSALYIGGSVLKKLNYLPVGWLIRLLEGCSGGGIEARGLQMQAEVEAVATVAPAVTGATAGGVVAVVAMRGQEEGLVVASVTPVWAEEGVALCTPS